MVGTMNGHSKETKSKNRDQHQDDNICRDFLRKVCHRGRRCKFRHPDRTEVDTLLNQTKPVLTFCHDYQNGNCSRSLCRFIHCSCEEEDSYLRLGNIPPHILDQAIRKGQIIDPTINGTVPICVDYLIGECSRRRGGKCKFRHLSQNEYNEEIYGKSRHNSDQSPSDYSNSNSSESPDPKRQRYNSPISNRDFKGYDVPVGNYKRCDSPHSNRDFKRDCNDFNIKRECNEFNRQMDDIMRGDLMGGRDIGLREYRDKDRERDRQKDELLLLRKQLEGMKNEISSLKKENSDLRATNEFLLNKVTSLSKPVGNVTTVTVPTVSITSTIPVATSVQHLTAAQVSHPITINSDGSVSSIVTLPPSLTTQRPPRQPQPAPQSLAPAAQPVAVAPPQSAVVGSVGGVVSLSQAPTLSTVNLNQSIASATSMAPSIAAPPPRTAQSLAQAMSLSGATGHLVTYPIMTQTALRPQIQ